MPNLRILQPAPAHDKPLGTFGNRRITPAELKQSSPKRGPGPEASVSKQCVDFMETRGWRAIRMPRGLAQYGERGVVPYGEPGQPDWMFIKYLPFKVGGDLRTSKMTETIFIEFKQPNSKRKCTCASKKRCTYHDQEAWRVREQARGAVVLRIESLEQLMAMEVWK